MLDNKGFDLWADEEIYFVFDELKEFFLKKIIVLQLYPIVQELFRLENYRNLNSYRKGYI